MNGAHSDIESALQFDSFKGDASKETGLGRLLVVADLAFSGLILIKKSRRLKQIFRMDIHLL